MALSQKDFDRIGQIVDARIESLIAIFVGVDGLHEEDRGLTPRELLILDLTHARRRRRAEQRCIVNRRKIINQVVIGVAITMTLGVLYLFPALLQAFKVWMRTP